MAYSFSSVYRTTELSHILASTVQVKLRNANYREQITTNHDVILIKRTHGTITPMKPFNPKKY